MHYTFQSWLIFMPIRVDHAELESESQVEQIQWVLRGPQASSCEDTNIIVIKASHGASNPVLEFCLS
jgi:hypothetical protein